MSKVKALPPSSQRVQNEYSYYESKSEFIITLHKIKDEISDIPNSAVYIIDWFLSNAESVSNSKQKTKHGKKYGCRFVGNETIAEGTGMSIRTIQEGIKWLKQMGLLYVKRTKGTAYKYWVCAQNVSLIIDNYFNSLLAHHSAHDIAHHSAHLEHEETPCESKAQEAKMGDHISTLYKPNILNHYVKQDNDLEEEGQAEKEVTLSPRKIKFKTDFTDKEIREANYFVARQMGVIAYEMEWSEEFTSRFFCYMHMGGIKYIAPSEIRAKNIEIEKAKGRDKKGNKIEDRALYMVKGIAMQRQHKSADRIALNNERAKEQQAEQERQKQQTEPFKQRVPFYNFLEDNTTPQERPQERVRAFGYQNTYGVRNEPQERNTRAREAVMAGRHNERDTSHIDWDRYDFGF